MKVFNKLTFKDFTNLVSVASQSTSKLYTSAKEFFCVTLTSCKLQIAVST